MQSSSRGADRVAPGARVAKEMESILGKKQEDGFLDMDLGQLLASTGYDSASKANVELSLLLVSPFFPSERDIEMISTPECY